MDICPSFPELDGLTEIESMLLAIYRPLTQIWTLRTGQTAYRGHVVNLEHRTRKFFPNSPSSVRPPDTTHPEKNARRLVGGADARTLRR